MLKIGDFSKLSRISIRMLRYYDEIGLLVPEKVDEFTGYRYYREEQLILAERIQVFKGMGFQLSVIGEILDKYQNVKEIETFLVIKRKELMEQADMTQERIRLLDNTLNCLRKDGKIMDYEVMLKTLPERCVASVRQVIPAYNQEGKLWQLLNEEIASQNVQTATPFYGLASFHDEGFKEDDVDVEIQLNVVGSYKNTEHVKFKIIEPTQIASATFKGSYEQIAKVNEAVANWIDSNGYELAGEHFCIYHVNPQEVAKQEDLVTEIGYSVKKK